MQIWNQHATLDKQCKDDPHKVKSRDEKPCTRQARKGSEIARSPQRQGVRSSGAQIWKERARADLQKQDEPQKVQF